MGLIWLLYPKLLKSKFAFTAKTRIHRVYPGIPILAASSPFHFTSDFGPREPSKTSQDGLTIPLQAWGRNNTSALPRQSQLDCRQTGRLNCNSK